MHVMHVRLPRIIPAGMLGKLREVSFSLYYEEITRFSRAWERWNKFVDVVLLLFWSKGKTRSLITVILTFSWSIEKWVKAANLLKKENHLVSVFIDFSLAFNSQILQFLF